MKSISVFLYRWGEQPILQVVWERNASMKMLTPKLTVRFRIFCNCMIPFPPSNVGFLIWFDNSNSLMPCSNKFNSIDHVLDVMHKVLHRFWSDMKFKYGCWEFDSVVELFNIVYFISDYFPLWLHKYQLWESKLINLNTLTSNWMTSAGSLWKRAWWMQVWQKGNILGNCLKYIPRLATIHSSRQRKAHGHLDLIMHWPSRLNLNLWPFQKQTTTKYKKYKEV